MARDYSKVKVEVEFEDIDEEEQKKRRSNLAQALFDAFSNRYKTEQEELRVVKEMVK